MRYSQKERNYKMKLISFECKKCGWKADPKRITQYTAKKHLKVCPKK